MSKTILITGSTDGIGLAATERLTAEGHRVLLHWRNPQKIEQAQTRVAAHTGGARIDGYIADLSNLAEVAALAQTVAAEHPRLDVLINNAGVFKAAQTRTPDGLDALKPATQRRLRIAGRAAGAANRTPRRWSAGTIRLSDRG